MGTQSAEIRYNGQMVIIRVDGQLEDRLKRAASSLGSEPQQIAEKVLDEHLPRPNDATLRLLEEWESTDATSDPVELAQRQAEGEAFMRSLARSRIESEGPSARKLWP